MVIFHSYVSLPDGIFITIYMLLPPIYNKHAEIIHSYTILY